MKMEEALSEAKPKNVCEVCGWNRMIAEIAIERYRRLQYGSVFLFFTYIITVLAFIVFSDK